MKKLLSKKKVILLYTPLIIILIFSLGIFSRTASNDRQWNRDQQLLSYADISEDQISIYNIRNINYRTTIDFDVTHYDKAVKLSELQSLDYMVEELEGFPGFAHTALSFGFKDGSYIAISVEIRKEVGESYHPLSGMMREYELMYVIADERDVINLRANYRNDKVYLYPIKISKTSLDKLFLSMLQKANSLRENPEFYNTLTSTCTTNLAEAASESTEVSFSKWHYKILLPGFSDQLLLEKGLIDTELSDISEVRKTFLINARAKLLSDSPEFSRMIRTNDSVVHN